MLCMSPSLLALKKLLHERFPTIELQAIDKARRGELERLHPGLPEEYLDYLEFIGWGTNYLVWYRIFDVLRGAEGLYSADVNALKAIAFFGGDFQGHNDGFDTADGYRIVEVDGRRLHKPRPVDPKISFGQFIAEKWIRRYEEQEAGE